MLILEDIYFVMESDSFKLLRNLFYAGQSSLIIAHEKKKMFLDVIKRGYGLKMVCNCFHR